jgi:hypothetical protein
LNLFPIAARIMLLDSNFQNIAEKVGKPEKKCENCIKAEKTKFRAMTLSKIRLRIELCMREKILRLEMNLQNLLFLTVLFIFVFLSKYPST